MHLSGAFRPTFWFKHIVLTYTVKTLIFDRFEELPHAAEFFVALFDQRAGSKRKQIRSERSQKPNPEAPGGTLVVQVAPPSGFRNNFIDDCRAGFKSAPDLERFRAISRFPRIAPQNRRANPPGNYRIHRILQHVDAIPHRQSPAHRLSRLSP